MCMHMKHDKDFWIEKEMSTVDTHRVWKVLQVMGKEYFRTGLFLPESQQNPGLTVSVELFWGGCTGTFLIENCHRHN
jgi:hypothetical protein